MFDRLIVNIDDITGPFIMGTVGIIGIVWFLLWVNNL